MYTAVQSQDTDHPVVLQNTFIEVYRFVTGQRYFQRSYQSIINTYNTYNMSRSLKGDRGSERERKKLLVVTIKNETG